VGVEFVELSQEGRTALDGWISSLRELDGDGAHTGTGQVSNESEQAAAAVVVEASEPTADQEISAPAGTDENRAPDSPLVEKAAETPKIPSSAIAVAEQKANDSARPRLSIAESLGVLEARPEEFAIRAGRRAQRRGNDRKWTALIVVLAILLLAVEGFYGLAHFRRFMKSGSGASQSAVTSAPPTPMAAKPSAPASPGFVVQAGAMARREDAVELADSLQQKGFPSFIFKRDSARLYEVVIGPYSTAEEAQKITKTLQAEGTDTFVRSWPFQ
jgi:septal ring-binding cell division protein DamX